MTPQATLTMQDIAQLAQVSRQAVTNWRRRSTVKGRFLPFPPTIATVDGVEHFSRDEILSWLQESGRGKNQEARDDAPALSVPEGYPLQDVVTFVALRAISGEDIGRKTEAELVELAETADTSDVFLLSEVRALGANEALASYADALMEVSYGPGDALDRIYTSRLARRRAERGLTNDLIDLLTSAAAACRDYLGADSAALDPRVDFSTARRLISGFAGVNIPGSNPSDRALLRHLALDEVEFVASDRPTVRVLSVVGMEDDEALETIDAVALDLGPDDAAVILGSSAVLCDALRGEQARRRAETVGMGRLVMAVRLPRGQWKAAHRQGLALWILKGEDDAERVVVADLSSEPIDLGDLASDLTAALEGTSARSFRYGRAVERTELRGRRPLVPPGIRAVRMGDSASTDHRDRVTAATMVTSEPLEGYDIAVGVAPPATAIQRRSLGELVESRRVELRKGCRIDVAHADPAGTVLILAADGEAHGLDPLDAVKFYSHAKRTLPNDVVFAERPRPMARVDEVGGSLVKVPSRVLRLPAGAGIGPHALAAVINQLPDDAGEWQTWNIPRLDVDEIDALERTLKHAVAYVAELRRRETAMHDLITNLIQGVAAGSITLNTPTMERAG
jgi:transcriptional regulator with XRE-family HTH domain